jgi:Uma2 family endonuclease
MIAQAETQKIYTPEEYFDLEVNAEERNEYTNGEIIPMTGGTPNHNRLVGNLYATLNFSLRGQPYDVFVTDQRLWIPSERIYTYPDVMVIQGELQFQEGRKDTLTNPIIIAEVLSTSTRNYDKDEKFAAYRTIPSFQEYLLIDQYKMHVEQYFKTDRKRWTFMEYDGADETVVLNLIAFQITLSALYDKVQFEEVGDRS